jgi:hypothetical protein
VAPTYRDFMSILALCLLASFPPDVPVTIVDPDPLLPTHWSMQSATNLQTQPRLPKRPNWVPGQVVMQGFLGVTEYQTMERSGGSFPSVDGSGESSAEMPLLGGGAQWKLGGEKIDFGLEAMFSFGWRANATAFAVGSGGAAIAVDVDTFVFEIYGGPMANMFLGDKTRVYVSAGPLMQWANYSQYSNGFFDDSGSGFGTGWYARTGLEFAMADRTMLGFGVRWTDSSIDLDNGLGNLDLSGFQLMFTVTRGF